MTPSVDEIEIDQPELIKHGSKYGVKLRAVSPSIHLIQANIETEIAPIVGTQEQANDLIAYIADQHGEDDEKVYGIPISLEKPSVNWLKRGWIRKWIDWEMRVVSNCRKPFKKWSMMEMAD